MIQIGVLLLGSTILAEMYFQNQEVEILRSNGGIINEETIDILSGNIEYRDFNLKSDPDVLGRLHKDRQRNKHDVLRELKVRDFTTKTEHLADLRLCNSNGETKLHEAAGEGQLEVVRQLLQRGQDPDLRTRDILYNSSTQYRDTRQTPLHYAAASGKVEVMRILLDYGADVFAVTESGDTPLHKAAFFGQATAVRWLLDHGSDPAAKNIFGATPLAMALVNQRKEVAVTLLDRGKEKGVLPLGRSWLDEMQTCPILVLLEVVFLLMFRVIT